MRRNSIERAKNSPEDRKKVMRVNEGEQFIRRQGMYKVRREG